MNHGRIGTTDEVVSNVLTYAASRGVRAALLCSGVLPSDGRIDWLYDLSFGKDVKPTAFPTLSQSLPLYCFFRGLGADNVHEVLSERFAVARGAPFWIDMESGVRSSGYLDISKCAEVFD